MRVLVVVVTALFVITACSGGVASGPPAAYTSHVCAASSTMAGELKDALTELSAVGQTGDVPGMLTAINRVQAATDKLQTQIAGTPAWPPGDALTADMRLVATTYGRAVKRVRDALATQDQATLDLALADVAAGNASIAAAIKDLAPAKSAGYSC